MQNRGPSPGFSGYRVGARYDKGCHSALDAHRVTPHPDAGSSSWHKRNSNKATLPDISGYRVEARYDKGCHPAHDAGSSS